LLDDEAEMQVRRTNGLEYAQTFPTEEEMAERVEKLILTRLHRGAAPKKLRAVQQMASA